MYLTILRMKNADLFGDMFRIPLLKPTIKTKLFPMRATKSIN